MNPRSLRVLRRGPSCCRKTGTTNTARCNTYWKDSMKDNNRRNVAAVNANMKTRKHAKNAARLLTVAVQLSIVSAYWLVLSWETVGIIDHLFVSQYLLHLIINKSSARTKNRTGKQTSSNPFQVYHSQTKIFLRKLQTWNLIHSHNPIYWHII